MIEANEPTEGTVVKQVTPAQITTTQIIQDLENGIDRTGIQTKYGLESWEVKQMFMHPALKGKKAKKVRKLSFEFVDDTVETISPNQTSIPVETTETFHGTVENNTNTQFTQF
jgi:hypothetical protein